MSSPAPTLRGADFVLSSPTSADLAALFETFAASAHSLNVPRPFTLPDAETYLANAMARNGGLFWAIRNEESGPLVGIVALRYPNPDPDAVNAEPPRIAEIGNITLRSGQRAKGLATRAAAFVLSWALDNGFHTIEWECQASNTSSIALYLLQGRRLPSRQQRSRPACPMGAVGEG